MEIPHPQSHDLASTVDELKQTANMYSKGLVPASVKVGPDQFCCLEENTDNPVPEDIFPQ